MFDGIDVVTLPVADIDGLLPLYVDGLGFTVEGREDVADPAWRRIWALPTQPTRAMLLGKKGSDGGWLRLVEVPGLPVATAASRPDRVGAYALDFYVRDADEVEARLSALGWQFTSEPQNYPLPGTTAPVRERMLQQAPSGLLHAIVQYRPGQTRCVLSRSEADVSEVVAAVFVAPVISEAAEFAEETLGARQYFNGRFEGEAIRQMLCLNPGEGFDAALFRGAGSRNARLEFGQVLASETPRDVDQAPAQDSIFRVVAGCAVEDLDVLAQRLARASGGDSTGILTLADGHRRLGFASKFGAAFDFWER